MKRLKKTILQILCVGVMIWGIDLGTITVSAADTLESNIVEDTMWDDTEQVYTLSADIQIKNGATLNIGDGVQVDGNGHTINVYGTLNINGASITDMGITACNTGGEACEINIENSSMIGGQLLNPTGNSSHVNLAIRNNIFKNLSGYSYIWYPASETYITGNSFDKCGGFSVGSDNDVYFLNNVFYEMTTEFAIEDWAQYSSQCYVSKNSFYDKGIVLKLKYDNGSMVATENYWNTTNESYIKNRISDGNIDFSTPNTIDYSNYLKEPDVNTPKENYQVDEGIYQSEVTLNNMVIDTMWDDTEQVYTLGSDIQIKNGVTLNIGEGVQVNGNGHTINVYGTLNINGASITDMGITACNTGSEVCEINIENSSMTGGKLLNPTGNSSHVNLVIRNNIFKNLSGYSYIWYPASETYITGNSFEKCGGFSVGSDNDVYFTNNVFHGMTTEYAIEDWAQYSSQCYVSKNSFYDQGIVLKLKYDSGSMVATGNYWNTNNESYIKNRISDGNTDFSIPNTIDYSDYLIEPNEYTPVVNHSYNLDSIVDATCISEGKEVWICSICKDCQEKNLPVDSSNHVGKKEIRNAKAATCTEVGYTGDTYCTDCNEKIESGTNIAALGHDWDEGVVTKAPTCTENGIKTYTCAVCGETKTEEIEATGHQHTEIRNAKAATCTEAGYTGDTYCTDCDEKIESGTNIAALGHDWDEGVVTKKPTETEEGVKTYTCRKCGETRTEVIPATGETPTDQDDPAVTHVLTQDSEGNWHYYTNGQIDYSYTGLASNEYGWWYVSDGTIDFHYTGMASNEYGWWYCINGHLDFGYTGMASNEYGWWYYVNGQLDFGHTGMECNEYGWWYYVNGKLDFGYTGMAHNEYDWWYFVNGQLDFGYTGMAGNEYGWWYYSNGHLDLDYIGLASNEYGTWYYKYGKIHTGYTGMVLFGDTWRYVCAGQVMTDYTGMVANEFGWWFFSHGEIDWNYTGMACNEFGWWYFSNGSLDTSYTGMACNENGWWYYNNGQLDWDYTGIASNQYGNWYFQNGRLVGAA